jgi:hypothetical protein
MDVVTSTMAVLMEVRDSTYALWEVKVGSKADWQFNGYIYYYLFPHNM